MCLLFLQREGLLGTLWFCSKYIITYEDVSAPMGCVLTNQGQKTLTLWFYSFVLPCVSVHLY